VAVRCECGDEPSGSCAMELVVLRCCLNVIKGMWILSPVLRIRVILAMISSVCEIVQRGNTSVHMMQFLS
jgi:hypothetical protein